MVLLTATLAWSEPVPGSLDVHWNEGCFGLHAQLRKTRFKSIPTSRKRLSCARVLARPSKRIFSIFSSAPTKLF